MSQSVHHDVGTFGSDTEVSKEPDIPKKVSYQNVPSLIAFFGLVVLATETESRVHLTPTNVENHE